MKEFLKGAERDIQAAILKCFLVVCLVIISIGCGSGRDMDDPKNRQEFEQLQELVSSREFEIENEWAIPMTGNMVNLMGNTNYIRFKRDSVDLFLPYFGVRHSGGAYEREGGIRYKGPAEDLTISRDEDDNKLILEFEANNGTENYQFLINLFSNKSASTSVTSSQRSSISYQGNVGDLPKEAE